MDHTDLRLLRAMGYAPFQHGARHPDALKSGHLARTLGLSIDTVKARISKMEEAGIIAGYEIYPNLRLLQYGQTTFHFHIDPAMKPQVLRNLQPLEGISGVFDYVGLDVCVDVFYKTPGERDRKLALIAGLTGGARAYRYFEVNAPAPTVEPGHLGWRIVRAMRSRGRSSPEDIAAAVGVSARTVKRHIEKMATGGAFDVVPLLNPGNIPNFIPVAFACHFEGGDGGKTARRIAEMLEDRHVFCWVPPDADVGNFDVLGFALSTGEIESLRRRVLNVERVTRVDVMLPTGGWMSADWLNEAIDERVRALDPLSNSKASTP